MNLSRNQWNWQIQMVFSRERLRVEKQVILKNCSSVIILDLE